MQRELWGHWGLRNVLRYNARDKPGHGEQAEEKPGPDDRCAEHLSLPNWQPSPTS